MIPRDDIWLRLFVVLTAAVALVLLALPGGSA